MRKRRADKKLTEISEGEVLLSAVRQVGAERLNRLRQGVCWRLVAPGGRLCFPKAPSFYGHRFTKIVLRRPEFPGAWDKKNDFWRVVIETPKGGHNKYDYDPDLGIFVLGSVLPEGMDFPYDFGFLPSTLADDGDPLDVMLLMDAPAFCGCMIPSRFIGVMEAIQTEKTGKSERNADTCWPCRFIAASGATAKASKI